MIQLESKKFFRRRYNGDCVVLRPVESKDADEIFRLISRNDLYKFTFIPKQYSLQIAKEWIKKQKKLPQTMIIVQTESKEIMGVIGIVSDDFCKQHWEIAYWLGQQYRGKGYMREALNLFLQQVKKCTPIRKISAKVFVGNPRSVRLLKYAGFAREGLLQNHFYHNGKMKSVIILGRYIG